MMTSATWSFVRVARGSTQALLVVLVSLFTLCASSSPQGTRDKASPPLFLFAGSLKQAAARAAERNVPIVAIALLDKESDNESARTQLLASPEIAKLSASCVLFFSNLGVHPPREIVETQDGTKRTRVVCSAFGTATCREHQQHWDDIYAKFNEDGGLRCPQVLVLAPDATLEGRVSPGLKPEIAAILNLARATQARLGRGLTDLELASVKDALARAARAEKAGKSGSMWRAFGDVLSVAPDGPRALVAEEGQKRAEEALAKQRDAATEKLGSGDGLEGWLALEELAKDWTPSEQAAELTRIMKRAEKEPLLRDALAKKRREDEAQALWNEAEAARSANQPKEAERKLRLLLKKYPGTPAGERVAKAHPDWTAP